MEVDVCSSLRTMDRKQKNKWAVQMAADRHGVKWKMEK